MNIQTQAHQLIRDFSSERSRQASNAAPAAGSDSYIVMGPKGSGLFKSEVNVKDQVESLGGQVHEELGLGAGMLTQLTSAQVADLQKRGFRVAPDKVENFLPEVPDALTADASEEEATAPKAEKPVSPWVPREKATAPRFDSEITRKYTGKDVTIAVLDSGAFPHPDVSDRLLGQIDFVQGLPFAYDDNGHGTHVSSCAAGSGLLSDGIHKGLASEANLISLKVLSGAGSGRNSDIIKGIEWCIDHKDELNIKVLNMSLGGPSSKDWENDPINQAVKAAYEAGLVVMVAAGNEGPHSSTIGSPGNSPFAITVGATDDKDTPDPSDDTMAGFSSHGPTKDGRPKPDIVAPGTHIFAAMAPSTEKQLSGEKRGKLHTALLGLRAMPYETLQNLPAEVFTSMGLTARTVGAFKKSENAAQAEFNRLLEATTQTEIDETKAYQALPGTSMATPIASGLVAAMFQANPNLSPDQVRDVLTSTADKLPGRWGKHSQGAGRIDPAEALAKAEGLEGKLAEFLAAHAAAPAAEANPEQAA